MNIVNSIKNRIYRFLKKTERYTSTNIIYLAKGGFWLTLGQIISTTASFLLAIAFANLLDPVTYGIYKYILSLTGILSIFTLTGMGTAVTQAVARKFEGSFYSAFREKLKFGALASITAIGLSGYYFFQGNYILPIPLLMAAVFLPLIQASGIYGNFLLGKKLFNIQVKYTSLTKIISTLCLILTLFLTKNILLIVFAYFLPYSILGYLFYRRTSKKLYPNTKEDPQTIPYGKHLSFTGIISHIASNLDSIILWHFLGPIEVAIYSFATTPLFQINGLISGNLQTLTLPKFSRKSSKELRSSLPNKALKILLVLIPVVVIYIVIAPFIYKTFFPQYLDSIIYSQLFSFSILFAPATLLSASLIAKMEIQKIAILRFLSPTFQILLLLVMVYRYGILGVILTRLIAGSFYVGLLVFLFKRNKNHAQGNNRAKT